MNLYLAMWVRGQEGDLVTAGKMAENKAYAMNVARRLRIALDTFHTVTCPHEDAVLNLIDESWLQTKDPALVPKAMARCKELLNGCDGIVLFHRGCLSEGMQAEKQYAIDKGLFVYEAHDLSDETLEDLVLELNHYEELSIPQADARTA